MVGYGSGMTTSHDAAEPEVLYEVADHIATITLNRPEARNALSSEVLRLLPERLRAAEADPEVDVIILTGADPAFSAGLDLKELGSTGGNLGAVDRSGEVPHGARRGPFPFVDMAATPLATWGRLAQRVCRRRIDRRLPTVRESIGPEVELSRECCGLHAFTK